MKLLMRFYQDIEEGEYYPRKWFRYGNVLQFRTGKVLASYFMLRLPWVVNKVIYNLSREPQTVLCNPVFFVENVYGYPPERYRWFWDEAL